MINRKGFIYLRKELSKEEFNERNNLIHNNLLNAINFNDKFCMSYISINNEVDTQKINKIILKKNKRIILPKTDTLNINIIPLETSNLKKLNDGAFGIKEPIYNEELIVNPKDIDIVLVPGVIFDKNLYRIGYGKGYYDRFLSKVSDKTLKVGLAYDFQIIDDANPKDHDIKLDMIITEKGIM